MVPAGTRVKIYQKCSVQVLHGTVRVQVPADMGPRNTTFAVVSYEYCVRWGRNG